MQKKTNWLKTRKVTALFALVAFLTGFIFLDSSSTGNAILNEGISFNPVSFIGLLLVFCSAVLALYSARNR